MQSSGQKGYICSVKTEREITVCFTGHRSYDGRGAAALRESVRRHYAAGYRIFITGAAAGFDLAAGECVLSLRGELPGLELHCAVPYAGHCKGFDEAALRSYEHIVENADDVVVLSPRYDSRVYHRRNDYMIERASAVIAWFDGTSGGTEYTVRRAVQQGLDIENLWLGLFSGGEL